MKTKIVITWLMVTIVYSFSSICYALLTAKEAASQVAKVKRQEQVLRDKELSENVDENIKEAISIGSCNTNVDTGNVSDKANDTEVKKLRDLGYTVKSSRTKIEKDYYGTMEISWCEDK